MKSREWEVWDQQRALAYIKRFGTPQKPTSEHKKRMLFAAELLEVQTVLDVGCGLGHLYPWIKNKATEYLGIDNSEFMIKLARKLQPSVRFKFGDIYDLSSFKKYDTVYCLSLLIHLPSSEEPIKEMWKHTRKALVFSVPLTGQSGMQRNKYKNGYLILRWETWENILQITKELKGASEVHRLPQALRNVSGLSGKNTYIKIKRVKEEN